MSAWKKLTVDDYRPLPPQDFPHLCSCGKVLNKEDAKFIGQTKDRGPIDWYNCPHCRTTFIKKVCV